MIDAKELARIMRTPFGQLTPNEIEAAMSVRAGAYSEAEVQEITGIVPLRAKPQKRRRAT